MKLISLLILLVLVARRKRKKLGRKFAENRRKLMKVLLTTLALSILPVVASSQSVNAQDAPPFMKDTFPEQAVSAAWQEYLAVGNPKGALDAKTKELIGLAVAAQIPCTYCVY